MIVEGTYTFPAPRQAVYELLQDPQVLAKALPGTKSLTRTGDGQFEGVMSVSVGPVTAAEFNVNVELSDQVPPERFNMRIDGKGPVGFTRGTAAISLAELADGTEMSYRADLQVGGKIAGVGQRLLDATSRMMTRQALEALTRELDARLGVVTRGLETKLEARRRTSPAGSLTLTPRQRFLRYAIIGGGVLTALVGAGYCFGIVR